MNDFFDKNHQVFKAYQKGVDIADYAVDSKLLDLAKNGDLAALKEIKDRKQTYDYLREKEFEQNRSRFS